MTLSMVAGGRRLEYAWIRPAPEAAPTLVLLHEGLGSLAGWRDFPAAPAAATGFGALVYSRAGYGGSGPAELPRPVRFMHDEAEVLGEILDAAGVRDAVLVGTATAPRSPSSTRGARRQPRTRACAGGAARLHRAGGAGEHRPHRGHVPHYRPPAAPPSSSRVRTTSTGRCATWRRSSASSPAPPRPSSSRTAAHAPHRDRRERVLAEIMRFVQERVGARPE
jgi:pimeloyl-ACP methyl ester carboxylesterase